MNDQKSEKLIPALQLQGCQTDGYDSMNRLAMLHLSNAAAPDPSAADHSLSCGGAGNKRRSPSPAVSGQPQPKKTLIDPPYSAAERRRRRLQRHRLRGFNQVLLPTIAAAASQTPPLRRSCSGSGNPAGAQVAPMSPESCPGSLSSPGNVLKSDSSAAPATPSPARGSSSLPPLPPPLRRSVSDPVASNLNLNQNQIQNPTPCLGPRTLSLTSSSGDMVVGSPVRSDSNRDDSPGFKKLRKMKETMKEMSQWWEKLMREEEDEDEVEEEEDSQITDKEEDLTGTETEESVSVECVGDCLALHFRCPCGKGYEILLSGNHCYYKLI